MTVPAAFTFLGIAGATGSSRIGFQRPAHGIQLNAGRATFGFLFFFLLFLAAVTSSLSMLQPGIAFLEESMEIGRHRSVAVLGFITAIGSGFVVYFSKDLKALDTIDFWVGTFLVFVLATVQIIIFGWVIGIKRGLKIEPRRVISVPKIYGFIMKLSHPHSAHDFRPLDDTKRIWIQHHNGPTSTLLTGKTSSSSQMAWPDSAYC